MNIFVARQPIFDKKMNTYGYELLYRSSEKNYFDGTDDNQATSQLINNVFLSMKTNDITSGKNAFINFPEKLLLDETASLLPKEQLVVEILERVAPTKEIVDACQKLKDAGYVLALDDFNYSPEFQPLIDLADIIKIEYCFINTPGNAKLINEYKDKVLLLAEKVETREEYIHALDLGFSLFQGYFFSKPVIIKSKDIKGFDTTLLQVINEINKDTVDFQRITEVIEKDIAASHKVLKIVNSLAFGSLNTIYSIKQALIRLGESEIKKWVYLMMLQDFESPETSELIKTSLVRAKMMELIAISKGINNKFEFFMAGMFSSIDILMDRPMADILMDLPLVDEVKLALLNIQKNRIREYLDIVLQYERGHFDELQHIGMAHLINDNFTDMYFEAYDWASLI